MGQAQLDIYTIIDQVSEAFFALDKEWRFVFLNSLASELLQRESGALIGKLVWDEFSAAVGTEFEEQYRKALYNQEIVAFEAYYKPLRKWFEVRAYPSEYGLNVYFQDISMKKLLEQEVQEKSHLLLQAQEIAEISTWEWDMHQGTVTWVAGSVRTVIRVDLSDSFDIFHAKMVHPEDSNNVQNALERALSGQPFDVVYRRILPDGNLRICHSYGAVFYDSENHPLKMVGVEQDITERVEEEKRLADSEEKYRSLVESSLNAIAVNDGVRWMYMNQSGMELFGVSSRDEIVGQPVYAFLHPDYHVMCEERTRTVVEEQKPLDLTELKWYTLSGELIVTEVLAMPVTFDGTTAVQLIIRDISARKRAENSLIQSEKLAVVGQLAAGVAHEIRNPLTSLKGFLQLLRSDTKGHQRNYITIMEQELSRIEMISNEMLMLAKPTIMSFREADIREILSSVVTLLEPEATMKNVSIAVHYMDVSPISCVDHAVKQVFVNLIKNSIEAMPDGGQITVHVGELNGQVTVRVEDHGCGMSEELLSRLGEPFVTTKHSGTGLGLMVTFKIVEDHGGTITYNSRQHGGTSVVVTFPVSR